MTYPRPFGCNRHGGGLASTFWFLAPLLLLCGCGPTYKKHVLEDISCARLSYQYAADDYRVCAEPYDTLEEWKTNPVQVAPGSSYLPIYFRVENNGTNTLQFEGATCRLTEQSGVQWNYFPPSVLANTIHVGETPGSMIRRWVFSPFVAFWKQVQYAKYNQDAWEDINRLLLPPQVVVRPGETQKGFLVLVRGSGDYLPIADFGRLEGGTLEFTLHNHNENKICFAYRKPESFLLGQAHPD